MFAAPSVANPLQKPVSVYALDYSPADSAAFTCYPTPLLGTNYCVMSRAASVYVGIGNYSQLAILATMSNTTVTITPSLMANLEGHTNAYIITNLQPGATYQINSRDDDFGDDLTNDVTGTRITSDQPIAVFAGDNVAIVPDVNTYSGNPLVQEQLPVEQWSTNALALSFAGRTNGDTYRVLAAYSNTVITISGIVVTIVTEPDDGINPWTVTTNYETLVVTNQAGQFFETNLDGPVQFQASKPIQVAQFANGEYSDTQLNANGDPCEILLLPTGRWLETNIVFTGTNDLVTGDFDEDYLNLIVAQSATNSTLVDGAFVAANNFVPIGASGYYGAQLTMTNSGMHTVTSSQPVGVEVYGLGVSDAYGYFGGVVK